MYVNPDADLVKKIASLRRCAPREFDEAVAALKEYSHRASALCVASPPDHLARLQGKAQQCAEIVTLFQDADKTANRIERVKPRRDFSAAV